MKLNPKELEKIRKKLVKLMALSASPNESEAALAMEKCKELMAKYNIEAIDVDPIKKTVDTDSIFVSSHGRSRIPKWAGILSAGICDSFSCIGVSKAVPGAWMGITFIGGASDVAIVSDLYTRIRRIIGSMGRQFVEQYKGSLTPKSRETYCTGVAMTVVKRIKDIRANREHALVIVKDEFVRKHCEHMFGEVKEAKFGVNATENTDYLALSKGLQDGYTVEINKAIKD